MLENSYDFFEPSLCLQKGMQQIMKSMDIKSLMKILSNMDKKDLEAGIKQAKEVLNQKNADELLNNIQKGKE